MSRVESDHPLFHLPPPENLTTHYSDHAQEIASAVVYTEQCYVTEVVFDHDGDLIYGQDIPFETYASDLPLISASGKNYSTRQQIAEISDGSYKNAILLYSGFPFSVKSRGRAVLKPTSHKARDAGPWKQALDDDGLDGLLAYMTAASHDLWNTSGSHLTARFLQPLPMFDNVFSGKQASDKQFKEAFEHSGNFAALATPVSMLRQFVRPVSITLWGLCQDYDRAVSWLMTRPAVSVLLEQTEEGTLFWDNPLKQANGNPPRVATEVADLRDQVLDAAIHYVLSGTFRANAWRGTVASRRSPGTTYKQTVATHLCAVYLDMMRSLQKRVTYVAKKRDPATRQDIVQPDTPVSLSNTELVAEFQEQVAEFVYRMEDDQPQTDPETAITAALRTDDPSLLTIAMALAVAAYKSGALDDKSRETISQLLCELRAHHHTDVATIANLAYQQMHQPL